MLRGFSGHGKGQHLAALAIARGIGDRRGEGSRLGNLGIAYSDLGDARRAIEHYEQALAISREIGDRRGEAISSWNLGLAYEDTDPVRAAQLVQIRVDYERSIGHPRAEADVGRVADLRQRIERRAQARWWQFWRRS